MDPNLVYAITPTGDEAVRQSTRVVQRNLRMVLVQVDGKMSVAELSEKIGNPRLVQNALRELEEGGFIAPTIEAVSVWEESKKAAQESIPPSTPPKTPPSGFSTFEPRTPIVAPASVLPQSRPASQFSSFGKPILPAAPTPVPNAAQTAAINFQPRLAMPGPQPSEQPVQWQSTRKAIPWSRLIGLSSLGLVAVTLLLALFFPYDRFRAPLSEALSKSLGTKAEIAHVSLTVFPRPGLILSDISIGNDRAGHLDEVRLFSPFVLLGSAPYRLSRIEVAGGELSTQQMINIPIFRGQSIDDGHTLPEQIRIERLTVRLGEQLKLAPLYGNLRFQTDGSLAQASFENEDRGLLFEAKPTQGGLALSIDGRAWKPGSVDATFASMQANAVLSANRLVVQNIDTTFLGGILRGSWVLDWSSTPTMSGEGTLARLDLRKVGPALASNLKMEGDLSGPFRLRSGGRDWDSLWRNVDAVVNADIARGLFSGADLGEASRRGTGELRGGTTRFERLRATVVIAPGLVSGRDLRIDSGMMTANGQFQARRNGDVDGSVAVTLQNSVSTVTTPLKLSGTLPVLTVSNTRK